MAKYFPIVYAILWSIIWWGLISFTSSNAEFVFYALFILTAIWFLSVHHHDANASNVLFTACGMGLLVDGILMHNHLIAYNSIVDFNMLPPLWILCLWALLGMGIYSYPATIGRNKFITALICGIAAPICYLTGSKQDAVNFNQDYIILTLFLITAAYAICGLILHTFIYNRTRHAQPA